MDAKGCEESEKSEERVSNRTAKTAKSPPKKRRHGQRGQIIKRGDQVYLLRVPLRQENGKRIYRNETFHGTAKSAQTRLTALLGQVDTGTVVEPSKMTLNAYLDQWLKTIKTAVQSKTFEVYAQLLHLYVRPTLGSRQLAQLKPLDIQQVYTGMQQRKRKLSARTVRHAHAVLRKALNQAVKWNMLFRNPALAVELPQHRKREMQALSPEQAGQFLEAAKADRLHALFVLAVAGGLRPGEYLGLQWPDVDVERGTVTVQRTLVRLSRAPKPDAVDAVDGDVTTRERWHFTEPKTAKSRRTIPLPASAIRALIEHRRRQAEERLAAGPKYAQHNLVFATAMGEPLDERNVVNRHFKPILKAAGLPMSVRLYDLRHTCATLLLAQGEHPKIVSERLGHANITLTLDTYSHVLPGMEEQAAQRLETLLFNSKPQVVRGG